MYPIYHFILTIIISGFLWPILGWKLALFCLGSFFIDVDHYWWYIIKFRDFSFKKAYDYGKIKKCSDFKLHIFHTFEFWILILVWGIFSEIGFVIMLGIFFHVMIDFIYGIIKNKIHGRASSFFEWYYSPSK
jgi:hypothetical protein